VNFRFSYSTREFRYHVGIFSAASVGDRRALLFMVTAFPVRTLT